MKGLRLLLVFFGMVMALSFTVSCKPAVPSTFISPDEMEDLLYDYHLADAMAEHAKGNYAENVIAYRAAVLKKYGVTQEKFDTSMVYYMRHTYQLHTIYEHVAQRMQNKAEELGASVPMGGDMALNGDTTDLWKGKPSIVLIPNEPYNLFDFSLKADTAFHKGDNIILSFHGDFVFQDGSRDGVALLSVVFNNDSVAQRVIHISSASDYNLSIQDDASLGIKEIKGFFLLSASNSLNSSLTTLKMMCLSNIHLYRMHFRKVPAAGPPAQPSDNMPPGSMTVNPGSAMSSDSMGRK